MREVAVAITIASSPKNKYLLAGPNSTTLVLYIPPGEKWITKGCQTHLWRSNTATSPSLDVTRLWSNMATSHNILPVASLSAQQECGPAWPTSFNCHLRQSVSFCSQTNDKMIHDPQTEPNEKLYWECFNMTNWSSCWDKVKWLLKERLNQNGC